jgi:Ion channel
LRVPKGRITDGGYRPGAAGDDSRTRIHAWQERIRDPSLTVLLALELATMFVAAPLAARGLPIARILGDTLFLAALVMVVMLSDRAGAIISIFLGLAAIGASLVFGAGWSPMVTTLLRRGGEIIAFSTLTWVVGHAVYAPGRITSQRLQGAVVMYLSFACVFASAYGLIWELTPNAFANLHAAAGSQPEIAALLYFSLTTLTTTGYGDIVAVDPFARSLANLESVIGVFYIGITVARLVTLEGADRRR